LPPPEPPVIDGACPADGIACNNDRDCPAPVLDSIGFCGVDGCCTFLVCEGVGTRQCEGPPRCFSSLPGATREGGPECDEGLVCLINNGLGGCAEAPAPAGCVVVPAPVTRSGAAVRLQARAVDARGLPSPHSPAPTWSTADARARIVDDQLVASCDGTSPCVVEVVAQLGAQLDTDVECVGQVRVYPSADAGTSRVIVVDERFAPLSGAVVLADGALAVDADVDGVVLVEGPVRSWTVVVAGREAQTLLDPPDDVVVVARPLATDRATSSDIVDFSALHTQGDIRIAVTGFALSSFVDARRIDVVGVPETVLVDLEGITPPGGQPIPLPSSLWMTLGDTNAPKGRWTAFGENALAWSIGAQVPLAELGPTLSSLATGEELSQLAAHLALFFTRGDHHLGARDDVVRPSTLLAETRRVHLGAYRAADGTDGIAAAFARPPGLGFIPLGFGLDVELDTEPDPQIAGDGLIRLDLAPPHDGIEGSDVFMVGFAGDIDALLGTREPAAFQLAMTLLAPNDTTDVVLPAFASFADTTFDGAAVTSDVRVDGATLYRVRFDGWSVWSTTPPQFALDDVGAPFDVTSQAGGSVEALVTARPFSFGALQDLDAQLVSMSSRPF
jgi:hypothetical protein